MTLIIYSNPKSDGSSAQLCASARIRPNFLSSTRPPGAHLGQIRDPPRVSLGIETRACARGEKPLSFRRFFELLESDEAFTDWFCCTLAEFDGAAFFWELPPLTSATLDADAEFVLIDAPMLARFPPERSPFASYFDRAAGEDVIVFPNLGGDAALFVIKNKIYIGMTIAC